MNNGFAFGSVMPPGTTPKPMNGQSDVGASADARRNADAGAVAKSVGGTTAPVERLETAQAIKPTPIAASAVKVEMTTVLSKEEFERLPITGPDKFAQGLAHMNKKEHEAKVTGDEKAAPAAQVKDVPKQNSGNDGVYEVADRIAEKKSAEGPKRDDRPVGAEDKPVVIREAERDIEQKRAEGPKTPERAIGDDGTSVEAETAKRIAKEAAAEGPKEVERGPELRDRPVGEAA